MAMINYADKVALNSNSGIADINKCNATDMNEIKRVVNENDTRLTTVETDIDNLNTYSTTEQIIGKWIDGKPIYRKVFTFFSLENSSDNVVGSINDISSLVAINGWANINGALYSLPHSDYRNIEWNVGLVFDFANKNVVVRKGSFGTVVGGSCVIVEYTKIND